MTCLQKLRTELSALALETPVIAASGAWPVDPKLWPKESLKGLGAVCSKGITRKSREGNSGIRIWETPCGLMNSIGLQNSGIEHFAIAELPALLETGFPLIVNLAPQEKGDEEAFFEALQPYAPRIAAIELNLSCPNVEHGGMESGKNPKSTAMAVKKTRLLWDKPLWVKLSPQASDIAAVAKAAEAEGADVLTVANTWLAMAMDIEAMRPVFDRNTAGLSGPAIFPLALRCVWELAGAVSVPIVASGGVTGWDSALAMLLAGASAVQLGSGLFSNLRLPADICSGLARWMDSKGFGSISEVIGQGRKGEQ